MSYTITPSEEGKYIILKHYGEINSELAMERNLEAHALAAKLGITRHLVDVTEAKNVDSVTKTYKFAYEDMTMPPGINKFACVAVLVSPEDHSHDFVETATQNAGQNVTLFRDRESAIKHLLKGT
jgi:uncharacterized cupredoxin-like copper-binding protein